MSISAIRLTFTAILYVCLVFSTLALTLKSGSFEITVKTLSDHKQLLSGKITTPWTSAVELTESSEMHAAVKLSFEDSKWHPEYVALWLRHSHHANLSQPAVLSFNADTEFFSTIMDLGDPIIIKPFNGDYELVLIVGDDLLEEPIEKRIALCKIKFRNDIKQLPASPLFYTPQQQIITEAPSVREDPPSTFTAFVLVLQGVLSLGFLKLLWKTDLNLRLFPRHSLGLLTNVLFLGLIGLTIYGLLSFWLKWTFLRTVQFCLVLALPTLLAANYAFIYIKKDE